MTVNSDSQSGRLRHDWQYTELTFPLAVRGFHIYTLTRLCTTDWKATESEREHGNTEDRFVDTGKRRRCWRY